MFFKVMLITAAVVFGWYLISLLFKFSIFKDNHKANNRSFIQVFILLLFTFVLAMGLTYYYVYSINRQDDFIVYTGIMFSFILMVVGFVVNTIYRLIIKKWNASYKEKYGEEKELYNPNTPVSILFDMAIIEVGVIGYKLDCKEILGICVSIIAGEYLGLYSMINKKAKEDTLLYKLKQIPFFTYVLFGIMIASVWFEIQLSSIAAFVLGIFLGVILITIMEKRRQRRGKHSDLADYEEMMHNKYESKIEDTNLNE